ncbi:MarC family protein [Anaeromyxobacter oryzisoli]|uniref:MarC family protein n=1 Tax=Anaeromyxobacter oryzisoli TaxID=2925408 RepID=UPI001F584475|nr:MarC family protein [Anaeromyxobacter sp. SG63]
MLGELLAAFVVSLSAIFFVVDPFSAVPFFLALTSEQDARARRVTALRASITAGGVLATFAVTGEWIFRLLGISLGAFKVAGGVVLLLLALDMIRTQPSRTRITEGEIQAGADKEDIAIVPLAMPLLAGPGSIATSIVLMARTHGEVVWFKLAVLAAIVVTAAASYLILAGATRTEKVLGRTGLAILERAAGLLLVAVAIQFMLDGLSEGLPRLLHPN